MAAAITDTVRAPAVAADADHVWRPAVMKVRDLKRYRALQRPPTRVSYRGLDVWGMGPPSSGGSTVGESLNLLSGFDLSEDHRARCTCPEASRVAFADRGAWLADAAFFDVPLRGCCRPGSQTSAGR